MPYHLILAITNQILFNDRCDGWVHEEEEVYRWIVKTGAAKDFVGPRIDYTRQTRRNAKRSFVCHSETISEAHVFLQTCSGRLPLLRRRGGIRKGNHPHSAHGSSQAREALYAFRVSLRKPTPTPVQRDLMVKTPRIYAGIFHGGPPRESYGFITAIVASSGDGYRCSSKPVRASYFDIV